MTVTSEAPVADWLDFGELTVDPYPSYRRLLKESPVAWAPLLNAYVISGFDACRHVELTPEVFSSYREGGVMERVLGRKTVIELEGEAHQRQRVPINAAVRPRAMKEAFEPLFRRNAATYLDRIAELGPGAVDLNQHFAAPLATQNLMDVVGLDGLDVDTVRRWSALLIAGAGSVSEDAELWTQVEDVRREGTEYFGERIPFLREHPDASMTSSMVAAGLDDGEIVANALLAVSGGMNEPQHMMTSIVWALSENPQQRDVVIERGDSWQAVFDETIRLCTPLTAVSRVVRQDTEVEGVAIPAGSTVFLFLAAANRDERRFPHPDVFDVDRPDRSHLGFGGGAHMCAGMWAANWSVGRIAIPALYERFEGIRADAEEPGQWWGFFFRGLTSLPVVWDADRRATLDA